MVKLRSSGIVIHKNSGALSSQDTVLLTTMSKVQIACIDYFRYCLMSRYSEGALGFGTKLLHLPGSMIWCSSMQLLTDTLGPEFLVVILSEGIINSACIRLSQSLHSCSFLLPIPLFLLYK